jgi:integrase
MRVPDDLDVVRLLDALDKSDVGVVARLAAYSRLRRRELLALRWRDTDFEKRTLEVRESLEQAKDAEGSAVGRFKSPTATLENVRIRRSARYWTARESGGADDRGLELRVSI